MKPNKKQIVALTVMLGGDLISHFADKLNEHAVFNSHRKLDSSLIDEVDQFADSQMQIGDQQPVKATGTYEDGTATFYFDQATLDQMNQHPDEPVNISRVRKTYCYQIKPAAIDLFGCMVGLAGSIALSIENIKALKASHK